MRQIELSRPYPALPALAARLLEEDRRGGARLLQWREAYPHAQFAEVVELRSVEFITRMLSDAYAEGSDYHPTVEFHSDMRAQAFADWVAAA